MAKYAQLGDSTEAVAPPTEEHLERADSWVDARLRTLGIDPAAIVLPSEPLREMALAWAAHLAALENLDGEGSMLADKAKMYRDMAMKMADGLTRPALGLPAAGGGFGSVPIGRA